MMVSISTEASAPPQDDDPMCNYPFLREMMDRAEREPSGAELSDHNDASPTGIQVQAHNELCSFCQESVAVVLKPVAILPCGHAYHVMCGRSLLFGREGTECTEDMCHRTGDQVQADAMRRTIESAVIRGDFKLSDLKDPVLRRDILRDVNELMQEERLIGARRAGSTDTTKLGDDRSEAAYEGRWLKASVAQEGFSFNQKRKLLAPFTSNPIEIKREDVTLASLYAMDTDLQRKDQEDDEDDSKSGRIKAMFKRRSSDSEDTITMQRFFDAGLSIADIYFKLELKAWTTLCDLGFTTEHFTNYKGGCPLTAIADLYSVKYDSLKKDLGWSVEDIVRVGNSAQELANVGLDFNKLYVDMGMQKQDILRLGYTARSWSETLRMDKMYLWKPLHITSMDLNMLRWSETEFAQAFALEPVEIRRLGISHTISAPIPQLGTVITDAANIERKLALARRVEQDEQQRPVHGIPAEQRLVPESDARNGDGWGRAGATRRHGTFLSLDPNAE